MAPAPLTDLGDNSGLNTAQLHNFFPAAQQTHRALRLFERLIGDLNHLKTDEE